MSRSLLASPNEEPHFAISARGLTKRFGERTAVNNLSIDIEQGEIFGFLGPNGSGKTTTIRMLCGLLSPTAGEAQVLGYRVPAEAEQLRTKIGYMTQTFSLYRDLTIEENLQFMGKIYGLSSAKLSARIEQCLTTYSLKHLAHRYAGDVSGGERQRLGLAVAVLHEPPLLFLDEPTSAVDPQNRRDFWERLFDLSAQGTTILVSTHYMDEAERCHRLAILDKGEVRANDTPQALMDGIGVKVVEVTCENSRRAKEIFAQQRGVLSSAQQGIRLRVLVDPSYADPETYLRQGLEKIEPHFSMETSLVNPSLEDVFVMVTRQEKSAGVEERP